MKWYIIYKLEHFKLTAFVLQCLTVFRKGKSRISPEMCLIIVSSAYGLITDRRKNGWVSILTKYHKITFTIQIKVSKGLIYLLPVLTKKYY